MVVAILDKKELNNKYLDFKVNLDYLSLSDKVVLLIANISNYKEKNILIDKLFRYLDVKNTKKVIEFLKKQKNKNIYILEDEDFLIKYINKLLIDEKIVNLEEYFKDNNLSSLYEITDILRKKNIKIMYNKDYRDFIKDVYKNVSKKN